MKKRVVSLFLGLILCVSLLPVSAGATAVKPVDYIESVVGEAYDAFAANMLKQDTNLNTGKLMIEKATQDQFEPFTREEQDLLMSVILHSAMYRDTTIESVAKAIEQLQELQQTEIHLRGSTGWYNYGCRHSLNSYETDQFGKYEDDENCGSFYKVTSYPGQINEYDNTLCLLVGSGYSRMNIYEVSRTSEKVKYEVQLFLSDRFDFKNDYSKYEEAGLNTALAKFLTSLGDSLNLNEFDWEVQTSFVVEVPFSCDHKAANYRWTFDGTSLASVTGDGLTINAGTKKLYTTTTKEEDGTTSTKTTQYFLLDETVRLFHDKPWVVEFTNKGSSSVLLAPTERMDSTEPFLLRTSTQREQEDGTSHTDQYVFAGTYVHTPVTEEQKEQWQLEYDSTPLRNHYGIDFSDVYNAKKEQTFRLENRVNEDGSNMIWISIDGGEAAPMEQHYVTFLGDTNKRQEQNSDWVSGKDFFINYIGNIHCNVTSALKSVSIWENGIEGNDHYGVGEVYPATCLENGYTVYSCSVCHTEYVADETEALDHLYDTYELCWDDMYSSAVLKIADCSRCWEDGADIECVVSRDLRRRNQITFNAYASFGDKIYTDTKVFAVQKQGDQLSVSLPDAMEGMVIAATYDSNGKMTGIKSGTITGATASVAAPGDQATVYVISSNNHAPVLPELDVVLN